MSVHAPVLPLKDAQEKTEHWRQEYNQYRPRSSLSNHTPAKFIRSLQTGQGALIYSGTNIGKGSD